MATDVFVLRAQSPAVAPIGKSPTVIANSGFSADFGRAIRTISGQSVPEIDKTNFVGKFFSGDAEGNPVPSAGTVVGGDATLRTDLADPAAGAALSAYQRASGVPQSVYHFIVREKCTPLEYGAVGDGTTDDTAALTAACANGKRVRLPVDFNFKSKGGILLPSFFELEGDGGTLTFDASATAWLFCPGSNTSGINVSQIAIEGVNFFCASDVGFLHLLRLSNPTAITDTLSFCDNVIKYAPTTGPGSGDRWAVAGSGEGARTNIRIERNQTSGPMQLVATAVGSGTSKHWWIKKNIIYNARSNAISLLSTGAIGNTCTGEDIWVEENEIYADQYTSIGVAFGLDNSTADRNVALRRIYIVDNHINIAASASKTADIYGRLGNLCANIGGFDSVADEIVVAGNDLHYGATLFDQATPVTSSGFSRATNFICKGNNVGGGDLIFAHLGDGAQLHLNGGKAAVVRPGANSGRIRSKANVWGPFVPQTADAEFTWYADGDTYVGSPTGTDRAVVFNANTGRVQRGYFFGCTIDSFSTGTRRAAIQVTGAGAPQVDVYDLKTSTAWALFPTPYERSSGTILDHTGGELFFVAPVSPGTLAAGAASAEFTITDVFGAQLGDAVEAGFSNDTKGLDIVARVSAANTIKGYLVNPAGNPNGSSVTVGTGTIWARFRSIGA